MEKPIFLKTILQTVLVSSTKFCISYSCQDLYPWADTHLSYDEAKICIYKHKSIFNKYMHIYTTYLENMLSCAHYIFALRKQQTGLALPSWVWESAHVQHHTSPSSPPTCPKLSLWSLGRKPFSSNLCHLSSLHSSTGILGPPRETSLRYEVYIYNQPQAGLQPHLGIQKKRLWTLKDLQPRSHLVFISKKD